jgi:pimeloyl-ACP methyl ester carboxylesterase
MYQRCLIASTLILTWVGRLAADQPLEFRLTFSKQALPTPFTGRVFVVVSQTPLKDAPPGINWFKPTPFFAQDVKDWQPDTPLAFQPTFGLPASLAIVPGRKYHVQMVLDRDLGGRSCMSSPGNLFSKPTVIDYDPAKGAVVTLTADQVVQPRKFEERPRVKLVDIESKLLSDFHKKPMRLRAGVALPKSFGESPERKYPVIYEIPGFGGDHFMAFAMEGRTDVAGVEMIHVSLDPSCRLGHHVFADSANNGPCGRALVEELIPAIERTWRGVGTPAARFVAGHSSGGWSSLWLQVTYPDFFGGVWSTAPDPVDFRDFQLVNIYEPNTNIFTNAKGESRPLARSGGKVILQYKPFSDMEVVMGRGGQLFSFEAVFSPRGPDGKPLPLWDRTTGRIDPAVAEAWKKYDIRLVMEQNWGKLAPKLARKLHVYMGSEDTFYLDGATRLLGESLKKLGSDAVVEIFPGRHHGNLIDAELRQRMNREMAARFRKSQ